MAREPTVSIIILNWNGKGLLKPCLDSVLEQAYPNYEVIVVDNDSTDDSQEIVKKNYPRIKLIENKKNLGYAEGNNVGINYALKKGAEYILLLNTDTVCHKDLVKELVSIAQSDSKIGIAGPKIYQFSQKERIDSVGAKIDWKRGLGLHIGVNEVDQGQFEEVRDVDYVPGSALLIKKEVIEKIGLLDSRYFMYLEDIDWSVRVKRAGYRIVYTPGARLWHRSGSSTGGIDTPFSIYYFTRNRLLFMKKHAKLRDWLYFLPFISYNSLKHFMRFLRSGKKKEAFAILRGFFDFFLGNFGKRYLRSQDKIVRCKRLPPPRLWQTGMDADADG